MPRKILIIDDKPFMVRLIQHHLERAGYQLIKARNKQEALLVMAQQSPELVVMDEHGTSAQSQMSLNDFQSKAFEPDVPVIRMTDVPQYSESQIGSDEVILTRPFSPTHLVAEVKRLMPKL